MGDKPGVLEHKTGKHKACRDADKDEEGQRDMGDLAWG